MKAFLAHGIFASGRGTHARGDLIDVIHGLSPEEAERIARERSLDLRPVTIIEGDLSAAVLELIAEVQAKSPGWPRARK